MLPTILDHGLLLLTLMAGDPGTAAPPLELSPLVSDGAVLQRGIEVPIRGRAEPGAEVAVTFDGARYVARADEGGRWTVRLAPHEAGGPYELTAVAGAERVHVRDIVFGDVWICSGQSNMEWVVADSRDAQNEIAAATDPSIRHFKVARGWSEEPVNELDAGIWEHADPDYVGAFTAVGYFFARELRKAVDVPIGLIHTSWGGSRIEPWMSVDALGLDDATLEEAMRQERLREQEIHEALRARIGGLPALDEGLVDGRADWADPALDDTQWADLRVPGAWEQAGYEGLDGIAWYRTAFELTAEEARAGIRLGLGMIDDSDISWVNGREIGRTGQAWNQPRVYDVPAALLRPGRNVVAVRVEDTGGGGGIHGSADLLFVETGGVRRPLADTWKFRVGAVSVDADGRKNQLPTLLYNAMIHPLVAFPIKGVLWYQGESNAYPGDAFAYRDRFAAMIRDWRARWGVGDFPFLFVQLANYMAPPEEPGESDWAMLRESQSAVLALPNTAQAMAIDLGEADDIHPRNKQDVGRRLALAARRIAYGEEIVHSGPVYRDHEVRDGRVFITFDHVGGGLVARGGRALEGFAVAGADRRFVWADATIEGNRVVVWSDRVPEPVAVRYGWADNPDGVNLYHAEGLPAAPFRTDAW